MIGPNCARFVGRSVDAKVFSGIIRQDSHVCVFCMRIFVGYLSKVEFVPSANMLPLRGSIKLRIEPVEHCRFFPFLNELLIPVNLFNFPKNEFWP